GRGRRGGSPGGRRARRRRPARRRPPAGRHAPRARRAGRGGRRERGRDGPRARPQSIRNYGIAEEWGWLVVGLPAEPPCAYGRMGGTCSPPGNPPLRSENGRLRRRVHLYRGRGPRRPAPPRASGAPRRAAPRGHAAAVRSALGRPGALLIVRADSADAALAALGGDPFQRERLIVDRSVREWDVVIGELPGV